MDWSLVPIWMFALILVALAFDFLNGLHDAANSIATVVATKVLTPLQAVIWAAFFNFAAIWLIGLKVADTVGKGIIDKSVIDPSVIFGALMGAIAWNIVTWWKGIPSSSSHALVGGLVGAGVSKGGLAAMVTTGVTKTIAFIFLAPLIGMAIAMLLYLITGWVSHAMKPNPTMADKTYRRLQLISSAAYSIGHGGNDAQKTMGIITVLLFSQGMLGTEWHVPTWVIISCYIAISLGTLMGGWRIIETVGSRITRITAHQGFCAQTGGSVMLFAASAFGIPVSTTHVITGSVIGAGTARRASAVRWNIATRIVIAWFITIPAAAAVSSIFYWIARCLAG
jgi:inorganic phosphate transporter, PiT family